MVILVVKGYEKEHLIDTKSKIKQTLCGRPIPKENRHCWYRFREAGSGDICETCRNIAKNK